VLAYGRNLSSYTMVLPRDSTGTEREEQDYAPLIPSDSSGQNEWVIVITTKRQLSMTDKEGG
jgi:hypothetical protein